MGQQQGQPAPAFCGSNGVTTSWGHHQISLPEYICRARFFFPAEIVVATQYHFNEFLFCINEPETLLLTTKKT